MLTTLRNHIMGRQGLLYKKLGLDRVCCPKKQAILTGCILLLRVFNAIVSGSSKGWTFQYVLGLRRVGFFRTAVVS